MDLFEYEGKQLFEKYNIPIPKGWLAKDIPENLKSPLIAKAQVLTGGRGKEGGIQLIKKPSDLSVVVDNLRSKTIHNEKVEDVYVEEIIEYKKELYLSIVIDRNSKSPVLIASAEGGVDIESVSQNRIIRLPINPLVQLQTHMIRAVEHFLNIESGLLTNVLQRLWELFTKEQAELVEVNPLFLLENNELVAGDAKITLSKDSLSDDKDIVLLPRNTNSYEKKIQSLGAVGVSMEGDIAIVTSGAGLGLATLDLVKSKGMTACTLVDLGGHIIYDSDSLSKMIKEIQLLNPKMYIFNFYFQVASCITIAKSIVEELGGLNIPIYVRLKGVGECVAREMLSEFSNIIITESLTELNIKVKQGV